MSWVRRLIDALHPKADVTDQRARRQWAKVRDADKVIRAYAELDVVLKLDARRK